MRRLTTAALAAGCALALNVSAPASAATGRQGVHRPARSTCATGDLRGTGEFTGPDLRFRRRSCCLYYRVPDGEKCVDCSLKRNAP